MKKVVRLQIHAKDTCKALSGADKLMHIRATPARDAVIARRVPEKHAH